MPYNPPHRPGRPAFGERAYRTPLARLRNVRGMTQWELAGKARISVPTIIAFETGRRPLGHARITTASRLAEALGVGLEELLIRAGVYNVPRSMPGHVGPEMAEAAAASPTPEPPPDEPTADPAPAQGWTRPPAPEELAPPPCGHPICLEGYEATGRRISACIAPEEPTGG